MPDRTTGETEGGRSIEDIGFLGEEDTEALLEQGYETETDIRDAMFPQLVEVVGRVTATKLDVAAQHDLDWGYKTGADATLTIELKPEINGSRLGEGIEERSVTMDTAEAVSEAVLGDLAERYEDISADDDVRIVTLKAPNTVVLQKSGCGCSLHETCHVCDEGGA